jgi:hypothetical protein
MNKQEIKEALDNNWNDRLFHYYKTLVNPEAIRPQTDNMDTNEWKDITSALLLKTVDNAPKNQKVIIKDGKAEIEVNETKTNVSEDTN